MSKHFADTDIRLARCVRCTGYVFTCHVSGLATAVDPGLLSLVAYREALIAGRMTYDLIERAGRPHRLRAKGPGVYAQITTKILGAHACGALGRDASTVELVPQEPPEPVCDARRALGEAPPASCPRRAAGGRTGLPVSCSSCESPPFDSKVRVAPPPAGRPRVQRCARCRKVIARGAPLVALAMPVPYTRTVKVKAKAEQPAYSYEVAEMGTHHWAIHADGCPGRPERP
jgi:hypothetical protein